MDNYCVLGEIITFPSMKHNVPAITVVADLKVHRYQVARKLQKSYEPLKTKSPGNYR